MSNQPEDWYTYRDFEGASFIVAPWPRDDRTGTVISWGGEKADGALIAPEDLPDVVSAMYRAAGIGPFLILPVEQGDCRHEHGVTIQPDPDSRPGNQPGVFLRTRYPDTRLGCGEARHLAWHLMLHAQQAEDGSKPKADPADAARITSYFKDATDEEIAGFLGRYELKER